MKYTCGIIVYNSKINKILCCHPTNHANSVWSIPKGVFNKDIDDSYESAALRELEEETNVKLNQTDKLNRLSQQNYRHDQKTLIPFYFITDNVDIFNNLRCNSYFLSKKNNEITSEVDKFKWFDLTDALKVVHPTQANSLCEFKQIISSVRS